MKILGDLRTDTNVYELMDGGEGVCHLPSETRRDNSRQIETSSFKSPVNIGFQKIKFPLCNFRLRHDETRRDIFTPSSGGQIGGQNKALRG